MPVPMSSMQPPPESAPTTSDWPHADSEHWVSHQPNVTGRGIIAGYSTRFWMLVIALGLSTGVAGSLLMGLLHLVEHASWDYHSGSFLNAARAAPAGDISRSWPVRRGRRRWSAVSPAAPRLGCGGGLRIAVAARGTARAAPEPRARRDLDRDRGHGRLARPRGSTTTRRRRDSQPDLRLGRAATVAAAAARRLRRGAGMAAVYNVPLGGALFALEVLLGTLALPLVLPAITTSVIATAVAWITLGTHPTYAVPNYAVHPSQLVWAALMDRLAGLLAVAWSG